MPWGSHLGEYPYPIMLCNISQNAMGQPLGRVPCQVQPGGWGTLPGPARGLPWQGVPDLGTPPTRVPPGQVSWEGTWPGYPLPGYPPTRVAPPSQGSPPARGVPGGGVPRSGQHREYLLHGGRYASCVHAGGLSCCVWFQNSSRKQPVPSDNSFLPKESNLQNK